MYIYLYIYIYVLYIYIYYSQTWLRITRIRKFVKQTLFFLFNCHCATHTHTGFLFIYVFNIYKYITHINDINIIQIMLIYYINNNIYKCYRNVGCLRCRMLRMRDAWDVEYLKGWMFGIWNVGYEMLAGFVMFIYKVSQSNKRKIIEKFDRQLFLLIAEKRGHSRLFIRVSTSTLSYVGYMFVEVEMLVHCNYLQFLKST